MLRCCFLAGSAEGCAVYRSFVPAVALQQRGHQVELFKAQAVPGESLLRYDAVVMERVDDENTPEFLRWLSKHSIKAIYQTDDDLLTVPNWNPYYKGYHGGGSKEAAVRYLISHADACIASTDHLRDRLVGYGARIAYTCENRINLGMGWDAAYAQHKTWRKGQPLTIGWAGGHTHNRDLASVHKALVDIAVRHPDLRWWFMGHRPQWAERLLPDSVFQPGQPYLEYPAFLSRNVDVAIAPLVEDEEFNRSKSPVKALEYGAAGLPVLASRWKYSEVIQHEYNGLLADSLEDWVDCLERLVSSPALRRKLGRNLHKTVCQCYTAEAGVQQWEEALSRIIGKQAQDISITISG